MSAIERMNHSTRGAIRKFRMTIMESFLLFFITNRLSLDYTYKQFSNNYYIVSAEILRAAGNSAENAFYETLVKIYGNRAVGNHFTLTKVFDLLQCLNKLLADRTLMT